MRNEQVAKDLFATHSPENEQGTFWIDFPEINRKVQVKMRYYSGSASLGCHSGTITNISTEFAYKTVATLENSLSVQLLNADPSQESPYMRDGYGYFRVKDSELRNIAKYITENTHLAFDAIANSAFTSIVNVAGKQPIWAISDVINYDYPARNGGEPAPLRDINRSLLCKTSDFVSYLIKEKIGVVIESPVIQNPNHSAWGAYSLNQMWIWIHPKHVHKALNCANIHNDIVLPSREQWLKTIRDDMSNKGDVPESIRSQEDHRFVTNLLPSDVFIKESRFSESRAQ